ncbi:sugar ABC transporter substrate-binding protein [Leptolyngbya sp. NK1-12]|uniref:Sugar ABC transporter substrate-binding protein n=2 Tax=Leptolyngbya sp. NK1-12 TaxID=2547451 RepID=A0AA97APA7_9CYAN|nr:sugar ABC transporter substrate-binding protein [Leptolyngbya sp. NK1-12]
MALLDTMQISSLVLNIYKIGLMGTFGVSCLCLSPAIASATLPTDSLQRETTSSRAEDPYTLGAGDQIRIDIFKLTQYSGENTVLVDGTLNLPVVGSVYIRGMTLEQAASAIAAQYSQRRILRSPIVTVSLVAPRPVKIGVSGEVNHPGSYTLERQSGQVPTLTQILEEAGGIRQSADLRRVQLRRLQPSGAEEVIVVDLWQFLQTGDARYNVTLRDGDAIVVPTAKDMSLAESSQVAAASFAADADQSINIAVVGEVFRPGPYTVTGTARTAEAGVPGGTTMLGTAPTVTRAIQVAGGITPTADVRKVQIQRRTRTGLEQNFTVDLWQLLRAGDLNQDAILQDGDTVLVPTVTNLDPEEAAQIAAASFSPDTIRINVVGEVVQPGVVEVPPNTPLNQALLAAGGFNNRAEQTVLLVRLNPNGSVSQQQVDVDFTQGIDSDANPALRNNDVIVVKRSGIAAISDALGTATDPLTRFFTLFSIPLNFFRLF